MSFFNSVKDDFDEDFYLNLIYQTEEEIEETLKEVNDLINETNMMFSRVYEIQAKLATLQYKINHGLGRY